MKKQRHERTMREIHVKKVKGKKGVKLPPLTYEEAADMIPIGAWISRLGEECSELAAAISKYKRALNGEFPCRTNAGDAFADVISEAVDVTLALNYCTENAFTLGTVNMANYQKVIKEKKAKIARQVMDATPSSVAHEHPVDFPQLNIYQQLLVGRYNPNAVYGTMGMTHSFDNPMRDAVAEDLYDD